MIGRSDEARPAPTTLPATGSAICVLVGGAIVLLEHELGAASAHMAVHIASMNLIAPLAAAILVLNPLARPSRPSTLWTAAVIQLVLLWSWHAPALQQLVSMSHSAMIASHGVLFVSALCFWWSLLRLVGSDRWHAIAVVLMTGKFACLLGVLLTFSPRLLRGSEGLHHGSTLSDQQLAGLLMVAACPLSYLVAGVVLAAQLIDALRSTCSASTVAAVRQRP
jgi:putative membrane protein